MFAGNHTPADQRFPAACLRAVSSAAPGACADDARVVSGERSRLSRAVGAGRRVCQARPRHQGDAVDGAWRHAQPRTRTQRTSTVCICWWAPTIASTGQGGSTWRSRCRPVVDLRHPPADPRGRWRIQRQCRPLQQGGERADGGRAPATLVDLRFSASRASAYGRQAVVTAARALGLRSRASMSSAVTKVRQVIRIPGSRPGIGRQQVEAWRLPAGRQHHAFGDAELHLARRQVCNHDRETL